MQSVLQLTWGEMLAEYNTHNEKLHADNDVTIVICIHVRCSGPVILATWYVALCAAADGPSEAQTPTRGCMHPELEAVRQIEQSRSSCYQPSALQMLCSMHPLRGTVVCMHLLKLLRPLTEGDLDLPRVPQQRQMRRD